MPRIDRKLDATQPSTKTFLLLFSKRSAFFCSFLKKRTKKLLFIQVRMLDPPP